MPHPHNKWPPDEPHHVDHILTRGCRSEGFECVVSAAEFSDHSAVRTELEPVSVPPVPDPDPPVPGPIPPARIPIAGEIEALSASIRRLQDELRKAPPGETPQLLEAIHEIPGTQGNASGGSAAVHARARALPA